MPQEAQTDDETLEIDDKSVDFVVKGFLEEADQDAKFAMELHNSLLWAASGGNLNQLSDEAKSFLKLDDDQYWEDIGVSQDNFANALYKKVLAEAKAAKTETAQFMFNRKPEERQMMIQYKEALNPLRTDLRETAELPQLIKRVINSIKAISAKEGISNFLVLESFYRTLQREEIRRDAKQRVEALSI